LFSISGVFKTNQCLSTITIIYNSKLGFIAGEEDEKGRVKQN